MPLMEQIPEKADSRQDTSNSKSKKKAVNEELEEGTALNSKGGTNMHVNVPSFLMKTYEIISDPLTNDIVAWNDEGEGFVVKHVNKF